MTLLEQIVGQVAPLLHAGERSDRRQEATIIADALKLSLPRTAIDVKKASEIVQMLLFQCLQRRELHLAAKLLWPTSLFCAEPQSVRRIWDAVDKYRQVLLPGASSMGKTYTPGVKFMLEWISDPEFTNVIAVGPSEEHLEGNLFTHLCKLHRESAIPLPGEIGERFIGLDRRDLRSCIRGVVIPLGKSKGAGRLQGNKRHARRTPHPTFGKLSRLLILLDELENIPVGIFPDIDNVISAIQDEEDVGFKIVGAYNPKDRSAKPAELAEPEKGWAKFDTEADHEWTSRRGWRVVRLDALKSENVVSGKVVYPGIQTKAALDLLFKTAGGLAGASWWTFGRGCYPPLGLSGSVLPSHFVDRQIGTPRWISPPVSFGGVDLAVTAGGDWSVLAEIQYGLADAVTTQGGIVAKLLGPSGRPQHRKVAFVRSIHRLPRGETVATAAAVRQKAVELRILPSRLALDRTGHGAGVVDVLRETWSQDVLGVNYSESPTGGKIYEEQLLPSNELFNRIDGEIWYGLRHWTELGHLFFAPSLNLGAGSEVYTQLTERMSQKRGTRDGVESKDDYKSRSGKGSPDEADGIGLGLLRLRKVTEHVLSFGAASSETSAAALRDRMDELDAGETVIDPTQIVDELDGGFSGDLSLD